MCASGGASGTVRYCWALTVGLSFVSPTFGLAKLSPLPLTAGEIEPPVVFPSKRYDS